MNNIQKRIAEIEEELKELQAPRLTSEDIEDVSDSYQEALEHKWYVADLEQELENLGELLLNQFENQSTEQ